ncbi:MAG TPA: hypothetical protein ENF31_00280, partial [bacterium]|nr:hypothetical protein [bacterium]
MKLKTKTKIILLSVVLISFSVFNFAFAFEISYPKVPGAVPPQEFLKTASSTEILPLYINYIIHLLFWVAGILALGALIYAGIRYLTAGGNVNTIIESRNQILSVFLGLLILFSSFIILKTLSPQFITLQTKGIPPVKPLIQPSPPPTPGQTTSLSHPPKEYNSSIDTEIPVGKIIEERILETKVPKEEKGKRKPRMERIKDIGLNSLSLAEKIKTQCRKLQKLTKKCSCSQAKPLCPGCHPIKGQSLKDALGPSGMNQYNAITKNISNLVGAQNLNSALESFARLSTLISDPTDFSNLFSSLDQLNKLLGGPSSLSKFFDSIKPLAEIAEDPTNFEALLGNLAKFTGNIGKKDLADFFKDIKPLGKIAKDPTNVSTAIDALAEFTG